MDYLLVIAIVFVVYLIFILLIAYIATKVTKKISDYLLADRKLNATLTALGAGAADMSSWLTMALPGCIYVYGMSMSWISIALILGAWANWTLIGKRLRIFTAICQNSLTIPSYLSNRFNDPNKYLRWITSIASIIFFTAYSAAGFLSGAIVLQIIFNMDYLPALLLSSGIIVLYTSIGGFLAINWIDLFQGSLMLVALLVVPMVTFNQLSNTANFITKIQNCLPNHLDLFKVNLLQIVACLAWGLGYFGQPHINARFMAIRSAHEIPKARNICIVWMALALLGAIATGLLGAAFYVNNPIAIPETIFIVLAKALFNPWVSGILLSAVLASIMSTISAQILITTSIVIEDLCHHWLHKYIKPTKHLLFSKLIMILISIIAIKLAIKPKTILHAVGFAWSGLGATFGSCIIFSLYWRNMTLNGAIAGVTVGMITVPLMQFMLQDYNILPGLILLPGFVLSSIAIIVTSKLSKLPEHPVLAKFDLMISKLNQLS